ncbi:50S ribosomal protein L6 [Candidatus Dependentiae bacterium]|jgi:large subunit ribosomal protein L6|nr:50S ribosomal protein L6 [Candidatus Dependentiae bacterium]
MSKIGRKPIAITTAKVEFSGNQVSIAGPKGKFLHEIPAASLKISLEGKVLQLEMLENTRQNRMLMGLNRALLANKVKGVETGFEQKMTIVGLGFKALVTGNKVVLSLGYTNKIEYILPAEVTLEVDKSGQNLIFKSADKFILGNVCDAIRSFRPPEPYKGTGIVRDGEVVRRKAGKTKSS